MSRAAATPTEVQDFARTLAALSGLPGVDHAAGEDAAPEHEYEHENAVDEPADNAKDFYGIGNAGRLGWHAARFAMVERVLRQFADDFVVVDP